MRHSLFIILALLTLSSSPANLLAQSDFSLKQDLEQSWDLQKKLVKEIIKPERNQLIGAASISAATFLSQVYIDYPIHNYIRKWESPVVQKVFNIDRYYGDPKYTPTAVILLYSAGLLSENSKLHDAGLQSLQAYVSTGIITMILKQAVGRARPFLNEGPCSYSVWPPNRTRRSFPSGHTSTTFAISTVMAAQSNNFIWKLGWYSVSSLAGIARIYHNQHWFSDVFFGGILGYAVGSFIVNNQTKNTDKDAAVYRINFSIPL